MRFGKRGKLASRYVGPFEILKRIGPVAYRLRLPKELSGVHDTFHVSNLKKYMADANFNVPLDEINVDKTLHFVEKPVEIIDREVKTLKRSEISIVKVRWNSKCGPSLHGEREDIWKSRYPEQLVVIAGEFEISFCLLCGYEVSSTLCSDSLLLTSLCCDDIHDVTPRVSALAGCDGKGAFQLGSSKDDDDDVHSYGEEAKVIQNGNSKKKNLDWKDGVVSVTSTRECPSKGTNDGRREDFFYQDQGAGKKSRIRMLLTMDDGVVNWGEHTEERRIDSGMSSTSKVGLGCEIKSNDEVLSYEEEMNRTVFNCTKEDFVDKPLYSRFSKTNNFKEFHILTGGLYSSKKRKTQQEIDDSLYVYGKKGPQKPETSVSDDKFIENSVTSNEEVVYAPKPKEAEPSCVTHVQTPKQQMKNQGTPKVNGKNWMKWMGKKLRGRKAELKKQRVFNTGNGVAKPVWNNANRVNHANHFVPRPVKLIVVRQNVNSVRPNVNTGRENVNSVRQNVNSVRSNVNTSSFNINTVKAKQPIHTSNSNSFSPGNWGTAVKTSAGYNWRKTRPNSNYNSGSNFVRTVNVKGPQGRPNPEKAWDHLDDFEEYKGGSVTFGGSKGYITGKGRIKVGNLEFDNVSFVKELGHFNLFSISQICDKHHKVLFTETECLVVSPDFKMLDANQILLKVHRQHNMYSFDMKTPGPAKSFACLIAKATSDESKLWHRRLGHINFKNLNKLVKGNLVRGLPSKVFRNDHTCVACQKDTLSVLGKFDGKCDEGFLVGYSLNSKAFRVYNLVTKKVEVNLHVQFLEEKPNVKGVGTSEVTNSAGTLQTPNANDSEEEDEDEELIVVPIAVKHTAANVGPRKSSTNSKAEEFLTELQNLKTQEKEAYSTGISEDTPEILAFRRELDELA
ncbi:ribonuclease H-like domain-containing protein [Tanacetum coccineum]